jgi:hypothetical protein
VKTLLSFLIFLLTIHISIAQTTAIPDANFEQTLIILGFDSGTPDGVVLTANIDTITNLEINNSSISDLTGIEDFTALNTLECYNGQLTTLDVSQNTALEYLECWRNQLTTLDVSQNTALIYLDCNTNLLTNLNVSQNIALELLHAYSNQLTTLNVHQNIALKYLLCSNNQLTTLNVNQNTSLEHLSCFSNQLSTLNVSQNTSLMKLQCSYNQLSCLNVRNGNNTNFTGSQPFLASNNSNLTCIEVDNTAWSTTNWTSIDPQTFFSTNCNNPCAVGIEENNLSKLSLYPNPTNSFVTIDLGETLTNVNTTLTNSLGQVILFLQFESTDFINLNIEAPTGIYFLQLESDGEVITKKIIKE